MKRAIGTETDDIESSTETESLLINTPGKMSDDEIENSWSVSVTSEEVAWLIRAVTHPLTQQLAHFCELMRELKNEQANGRHEKTAAFRATSSSSGSGSRCDRLSRLYIFWILFCLLKSVCDAFEFLNQSWNFNLSITHKSPSARALIISQ